MEESKVDSHTFMYTLYILFKANLITRYNLTKIFEEIKKDVPTDITQYLVNEEARKG